ncbi:pentatricopeptide repeat-containing protein At1g08070, chloroplastic-like isoform X2 [Diospyros lotus]|uniref:pentatricopeptide repeat-containing protein At1g08070, chloroplastic-like isoform X2 n=1 Tax=Diospyros lotus TaxID=55363 RepID=UPI00225711E8|nr:pentatricopeptide repeat-containing protein At1g08070, chloroplastic-like isoform X2 [Diospyros lotus]
MNQIPAVTNGYFSRQNGPFSIFKILRNYCFCSMQQSYPQPTSYASILQQVKGLKPLSQVHANMVTSGVSENIFLSNRLINSYASFGLMVEAGKIFCRMPCKNVVSWTILVSAYAKNDLFFEAIDVFREMITSGVPPNAVTISSILPAFGHADCGFGEEAFGLFSLMRREGFSVDCFTMMGLISAVASMDCRTGVGVHGYAIRTGFENDQLVRTALMDMYVSGKYIEDACLIFNEMPMNNVVTWTLMLKGLSRGRYWKKAMNHFNEMMRLEDLELDAVSFISILSICSSSGSLQQGRRIHAFIVKTGFAHVVLVGSAIIDMYANCASLEDAKQYFEEMDEKDVACWNAMIAGNGMNGNGNNAVNLFFQMKDSSINPNELTLLCILSACSHAGMVDQGLHIFRHMVSSWGVVPNSRHYACVIDLLGRAGKLCDAYSLVNSMPLFPSFDVYCALLSACKVHGEIELAIEISEKLFGLEPNDAGYYALLSNMYASAGNWEAVRTTQELLRSKGLNKDPGLSSIEINGELCTFMAGQKDHPQYLEVQGMLKHMISEIKEAGYVLDTKLVLPGFIR